MPDWLYVVVSVLVAAFVGGVTNHFAIKMLFHPRKPVYIGKWHVPFTPGLIPKRRDDIAASLGQVVADYLVTAEGLQEVILRPATRDKLGERLLTMLGHWDQSELTLRDAALRVWREEQWEEFKVRLVEAARLTLDQGFQRLWNTYDLDQRLLREVIPGWSEENRRKWSAFVAEAILRTVEDELLSAEGQRMLSKMASGMMDKAGGFLGTMAAIFMDEDKLVQKMTPALMQTLRSEEVLERVTKALEGRMEQYGEKPAAELLETLTGEAAKTWIESKLAGVPMESWVEAAEAVKVRSLLSPWKQQAITSVPAVSGWLLTLLARSIPGAMKAVQLPKLVQEQVEKFPIERLENIILSLSGKEFRAITWLGVLLGGIIGLFQSLLMLWMG